MVCAEKTRKEKLTTKFYFATISGPFRQEGEGIDGSGPL
jgi:hypothetical protein